MTSGSRFVPLSFRNFFLADIISLKTIAKAVLRLRHPFVFRVRLRTVAKSLSINDQTVILDLLLRTVVNVNNLGEKSTLRCSIFK